jgi:hypothetical protein
MVAGVQVDWGQKSLVVNSLDVANFTADVKAASDARLVLHVATCNAQLSGLARPDWGAKSLMPSILVFDSMGMDKVTLSYDIDSEGGNMRSLSDRLSVVAGNAMKNRLNAIAAGGDQNSQLFIIDALNASDIRVEARSIQNPSRNKVITIQDVILRDIGRLENGISFDEVVDKVSRILIENVEREVLAQGVIEIKPVIAPTTEETVVKKRRKVSREYRDANVEPEPAQQAPAGGKTKKFFKEVGGGFKQVGKGIGNLFRRDK